MQCTKKNCFLTARLCPVITFEILKEVILFRTRSLHEFYLRLPWTLFTLVTLKEMSLWFCVLISHSHWERRKIDFFQAKIFMLGIPCSSVTLVTTLPWNCGMLHGKNVLITLPWFLVTLLALKLAILWYCQNMISSEIWLREYLYLELPWLPWKK